MKVKLYLDVRLMQTKGGPLSQSDDDHRLADVLRPPPRRVLARGSSGRACGPAQTPRPAPRSGVNSGRPNACTLVQGIQGIISVVHEVHDAATGRNRQAKQGTRTVF